MSEEQQQERSLPKALLEAPNVERCIDGYLNVAYKGKQLGDAFKEELALAYIAGLAKGTDVSILIGRNEDMQHAANVLQRWQQKMAEAVQEIATSRKARNTVKDIEATQD